jgi:hypothetical protein
MWIVSQAILAVIQLTVRTMLTELLCSVGTSSSAIPYRRTSFSQSGAARQLTETALTQLERQITPSIGSVCEQQEEKAIQLSNAFQSMGVQMPERIVQNMARDAVMQTYDGNYSGRGGYH